MRNPTIDILRAVAVLLVFCRHTEGAFVISHFGWVGVDLFFVLSGFLVSGLLFEEYRRAAGIAAGRFLIRRAFKIYPQFYLFLGVSLAVLWWLGEPPAPAAVAAEGVFVQNYRGGIWAHTWSLAVEEHFYLLLAAAIAWMARKGGTDPFVKLPALGGILCALILGARIGTWLQRPDTADYTHVFPSHLRMDSLLAGVMLAYQYAFHRQQLQAWAKAAKEWLQPMSVTLLLPVAFLEQSHPFVYTFGFSLTAWGFVLLLTAVVCAEGPTQPGSSAGRAMAALGRISYAFYLWHGLVLFCADRYLAGLPDGGVSVSLLLRFVVTFSATLSAAYVTTWAVESPFLRVRDRWFPSRLAVVVQPGSTT